MKLSRSRIMNRTAGRPTQGSSLLLSDGPHSQSASHKLNLCVCSAPALLKTQESKANRRTNAWNSSYLKNIKM